MEFNLIGRWQTIAKRTFSESRLMNYLCLRLMPAGSMNVGLNLNYINGQFQFQLCADNPIAVRCKAPNSTETKTTTAMMITINVKNQICHTIMFKIDIFGKIWNKLKILHAIIWFIRMKRHDGPNGCFMCWNRTSQRQWQYVRMVRIIWLLVLLSMFMTYRHVNTRLKTDEDAWRWRQGKRDEKDE